VTPGKAMGMDESKFVAGQLAGPGSYRCTSCGATFTEYALSHEIEECSCGGLTFERVD